MARRSLQPNAQNCSLAELETALKAAPSRSSHDRLQAIKALVLGGQHDFVARLFDVTRQTPRVWVKAFNAQGIDGLIDKGRPGRPRKIPPEQTERLSDLLIHPDKAELAHWTAKKFHGYLRERLQIECGYRTVARWLHEHDFRLKVPQPWPDRQDEALRQAFLERLRGLLGDAQVEL